MYQPSEFLRVGGYDVVTVLVVLLGGDVATIGEVLDAQRRLELDAIPLLLK